MAEVKRRNGIPSMPMKNPPSFNHSSTSYKHIYDDVFASPLQSRQQSTAFIDDDYAEMFGSTRSNNGTWSISYSSIPVLDLPPPTEMRVRGVSGVTTVSGDRGEGNLDYSGVFGGFEDGNFGLPNGEELFDHLKKKTKTSSNVEPRGKVQTVEAQSIDNLQDFKRNKKEDVTKKSGEIKRAARARDFPGTTNKVEETVPAQTTVPEKIPVIKDDDTQLGKDVNFAVKQGKHDRHISMDLGADVKKNDSVFHKESGLSASNPTDNAHDTSQSAIGSMLGKDVNLAVKQGKHDRHISMDLGADVKKNDSVFHKESGLSASNPTDNAHDTSQSAIGSTNTFSQPSGGPSNSVSETSDGTKHFDHMKNEMHNTGTSEPICAAEVQAIPESTSTSTLHETEPTQLSGETSVIEDNIETKMNVNMSEKQGKHSISTCSEPKASLNNGEPFSLDTSQDTPQVTMEAGPSKQANDDINISFDVRRKGRHSRITSLDLGDRKHSREQDGQSQRKPRFGGSYSFDASNDSHAARVKVQPSMMAPSSSVPQFFPVESHYKISENSTWRNFRSDVYRDGSVSPPSLDEQLDMNSAAAMSAVALQRAIEEASMIFQMAKEYLERESQGSSKVRFKDTLKVKVAKDEQFADEMDEFQHYMTYESCPPIDTVKPKLSFVKDTLKVKVSKDNQLEDEMNRSHQTMIHEICPPRECEKERLLVSERPSVMEKGRSSQVEDLKKFSNDVPTVQDQNNKAERHEEDTIIHDNSLPVGSGKERLSLSESTSVLENGLPSQILEDPKKLVKDDHQDGKKFVQDEGCMEGRNLDMSKYTDERDRQEGGAGGEWEAAKHFNQLFCGVKNKIASFMAWQTDTEKKEDLMDTDACRRSQLQSEGGPDLVDIEHAEMKTKLTNQVHAGCPGEHVEMEIGFLSEIVDPCEDESVWSNTAGPEKAESSVSLNPVVASSSPESLIFFPFRNEEIHDLMDTNVEQNIGSEESSGIELMNVREEVLSEMKYEQLQDKCEENNHKALDDACITQNREVLDDDFMNQNPEALDDSCTTQNHEALDDSNIEEINKIVEESCLLAGKERNESTKEDPKRSLNEESGDDPMHDSHYSESTTERIDENGNCGEDPKRNLDEECREDPLHDSHFPEITTESTDEEYDETKESENGQHDAQILEETDLEGDLRTGIQATEETHECQEIERDQSQTSHIEEAAGQMHGCNEFMTDDTLDDRSEELEVTEKESFSSEDACMKSESICIEVITEEITEEASFVTEVVDELTETKNEPIEDTAEQVACFGTVDDDSQKAEDVCLSESEGPFTNDHGNGRVEEVVSSDEKHDSTMEILKSASEAKLKKEETVEFYDSFVELDGITEDEDDEDDDDETLQVENLHSSQSDVYPGKGEIDANVMETESRDILENQTEHVQDSEESLGMGVTNTISGQEVEKCGVDAVQKRRRWFDNGVKVGLAERPSILEGDITEVETDQEALDESILAGSVEIHSDELGSGRQGVNQESVSVNSESTPKRRRWSVKIGEEGLPVPPPLFQGINVEEPQNIVNETLPHSKSESSLGKLNAKSGETLNATEADVSVNWQKDKSSVEVAPRRKRWFASDDNVAPISQPRSSDDAIDQDFEVMGDRENQKCENSSIAEETEVESCKMEEVNDRHVDEMNRKEKERMVVERAIREARERAFAEARDRARRDTSERPNVEVRQKVGAGAQERVGKVPAEARGPSDKASMDAKLRAERAAVERATSEARERALQKALSEKGSHRPREQKNTSSDPNFQSSSSFSRADLSNKGEKYDGFDSESAQRRKTRTERQSRTTEQAATALEEKNRRDLLVQKEQAAKNMMADSLDAELKRWSAGKEGNLRLLLSTLQYILGPESGWQAVSLTDLMAATAVRKAYKKATLCVHPDKLQQRGATIQQKYICERVFDLLKDAWSKLNPNER